MKTVSLKEQLVVRRSGHKGKHLPKRRALDE
jgi:hypothetical protein